MGPGLRASTERRHEELGSHTTTRSKGGIPPRAISHEDPQNIIETDWNTCMVTRCGTATCRHRAATTRLLLMKVAEGYEQKSL